MFAALWKCEWRPCLLVTTSTLKWFWGWRGFFAFLCLLVGFVLFCWLFTELLQCSSLSCWIFIILDWLRCCLWVDDDKTNVQNRLALGEWLSSKKLNLWSGMVQVHEASTSLLVFWEQVGFVWQVHSCKCFRKFKCVRGEIQLLFHSTFVKDVFIAFSKHIINQFIWEIYLVRWKVTYRTSFEIRCMPFPV